MISTHLQDTIHSLLVGIWNGAAQEVNRVLSMTHNSVPRCALKRIHVKIYMWMNVHNIIYNNQELETT